MTRYSFVKRTLIKLGVWEEFKYYFKKTNRNTSLTKFVKSYTNGCDNVGNIINDSIVWSETKEGFDFWREISSVVVYEYKDKKGDIY